MMNQLSVWHCTTEDVSWPGCGACDDCRADMPVIYAFARALVVKLGEAQAEARHWRDERNAIARLRADALDERDTERTRTEQAIGDRALAQSQRDQLAIEVDQLRSVLGLGPKEDLDD